MAMILFLTKADATRKLLRTVPQRIANKPVVNLTAADCARIAREALKSKDTFVRRLVAPELTEAACKSGRTYAAAVNRAAQASTGIKVFTQKGRLTRNIKAYFETLFQSLGLSKNSSGNQMVNTIFKKSKV